MPGSEALTAALGVAMRLSSAEQGQLRQILTMAPELSESARYMRDAPAILKPTIDEMRNTLVTNLAAQWSMNEDDVVALIEALTPEPEMHVGSTDTLAAYLTRWRAPMTGSEAAERMLQEHYALGWTPELVSETVRKFHHATVSALSLGGPDGQVKIKARSVDVVLRVMAQAGPFNPAFTTELSIEDIRRVLQRVGIPGNAARDMGKVGAAALAEAVTEATPKALFSRLEVGEAADLTELNKVRPLLSQVADFLVRQEVQDSLKNMLAQLETFYSVEGPEATDKALFNLGYRGRPLRRIIPYTGQAEEALIELRGVLTAALGARGAAADLPPEERRVITALQNDVAYALEVNDDLRRGATPLGPRDEP